MTQSRDESERRVARVQGMGKALARIGEAIAQIDAINRRIATAAGQHSAVSTRLSCSAHLVAQAVTETDEQADETAQAGESLQHLADGLHPLVDRFKI